MLASPEQGHTVHRRTWDLGAGCERPGGFRVLRYWEIFLSSELNPLGFTGRKLHLSSAIMHLNIHNPQEPYVRSKTQIWSAICAKAGEMSEKNIYFTQHTFFRPKGSTWPHLIYLWSLPTSLTTDYKSSLASHAANTGSLSHGLLGKI